MIRNVAAILLTCVIASCILLLCSPAGAEPIHAVAEQDAVLHYVTSGDAVAGPGADLVREVLRRAGLDYDMKIYPWPRAYMMAQTQSNILIFSMARTKEREDKFKWVGEVLPVEYRFIKLKTRTDIGIRNFDDARKYSIGVINQDVSHRFLIMKDFPSNKLDIASSSDLNVEKLLRGRTDLIIGSASNPHSLCVSDPGICDKLETAFNIDEMKTSLYMAFSEATPDEIVLRARNAYDAIRIDGTWDRIMKNAR